MKILTNSTLQAVLLMLILGVYAYSLSQDIKTLGLWKSQHAKNTARDLILVNDQPSGIDIFGNHLVPNPSVTKKNLVFLLRFQNLKHDVDFWTSVSTLMSGHKEIGLVAYCDGQQCIDSMSKMQPVGFPILGSGEAISIETIAKADTDGNALLKKLSGQPNSKIMWRSPQSSPEKTALEAMR